MRNLKSIHFSIIFLTLTLLALFPACSQSTGPLIPDSNSPIADVPVPSGFTMTGKSTSKLIPDGMRIVDHFYKGSDDYLPTVQFYREQMPTRGWTLNQQIQAQDKEITLLFTNAKTNEDCAVTVKSKTFDTSIHIKIDPRGAAPTPRPETRPQ